MSPCQAIGAVVTWSPEEVRATLERELRTVRRSKTLVEVFGWKEPTPRYVTAMPSLWASWAKGRTVKRDVILPVFCTDIRGDATVMCFDPTVEEVR